MTECYDWDDHNQTVYDDLIVAIEASQEVLSIFLAVCDDPQLKRQIIHRYETEVQPDLQVYQVTLPTAAPSMRNAIAGVFARDAYLREGGRAVITVLGAEALSMLHDGEEKSQQEQFWGYLQWTREGLRDFPYPMVLWLTNQSLGELSRHAPDFWSWRKDVFRFISKKTILVPHHEVQWLEPLRKALQVERYRDEDGMPLADVQRLIAKTEAKLGKNLNDPLLATLYVRMGQIYRGRLDRGESENYLNELTAAIGFYEKAAAIQETLDQDTDLGNSLGNLAGLYKSTGRYSEAEPLYIRALKISEAQLGAEHPDTGISLNNLAGLYESTGRYSEAEPLYTRALKISEAQLGAEHPSTGMRLNNLALLYASTGRYGEAEPLYIRAILIFQKQLGEGHPHSQTVVENFLVFLREVKQSGLESGLSNHPLTQKMLAQVQSGENVP